MKIDLTTKFDMGQDVIASRRSGRGGAIREAKGRVIAFSVVYMNGGAPPFVRYDVQIESPRNQQWHVTEEHLRPA
jgi:hypothetical protein